MTQEEFRKHAKRIKKFYRMGAVGRSEMRMQMIDIFIRTFGKYPRSFIAAHS